MLTINKTYLILSYLNRIISELFIA